MNRALVKSRDLKSVGYDSVNKVLEIEFNTHTIYQYSNVPEIVYQKLLSADSKGKFFHRFIKDKYKCIKIR